ncbi:hypothetical protein GCM10009628_12910 [Paeniglutamicibacter kerguelensis]
MDAPVGFRGNVPVADQVVFAAYGLWNCGLQNGGGFRHGSPRVAGLDGLFLGALKRRFAPWAGIAAVRRTFAALGQRQPVEGADLMATA